MSSVNKLRSEDITLSDLLFLYFAVSSSLVIANSLRRTNTLLSAVDRYLSDETLSVMTKTELSNLRVYLLNL